MGIRHFSKIYISLALIFLIMCTGVVGFILIEGYNILDAFYMTVITVATVGFQEVHPLSEGGRMFTAFLIITSFGTFAYAAASISKYIADGEFNHYFKYYKVTAAIEKLEGHVIICGFGRNGKQAAHVLKKHNTRFVVIEEKKEVIDTITHRHSDLVVHGDATHDEVLERAGIAKAKAVITTLPVDADNLFIVLSAKTLNPKLNIISRASEDNSDKKLKLAGADNVIMPDKIGGAHMASLVMKPDVMEFVDFITGQGGDNIRLEEITFANLSEKFQNKTIRELEVRNRSGANIIGFKTAKGDYVINPNADTMIIPDAKLFVLGTTEQINALKELFV
ncbi:MAG: Potassium uptake protein TrkA family [Bacteroidota bacterium]|nr:Potassium uptake protein TrkA family [Bacteroidota bacterium]